MVKAVVIWAVALGMVGRGQHGGLVPVDGVEAEKVLHFGAYLRGAVPTGAERQGGGGGC